MFQYITRKTVAVAISLAAMTTAAFAGPLGSAPAIESRTESVTPVAFVYDGQAQVLVTAIEGFAYKIQQNGDGSISFVDSNGIPWVPVLCCLGTQIDDTTAVIGGVIWEQSGAYGAPLVYDGGINAPFAWQPSQ